MSNPNPLIPQGTFQAQSGKGASNVRIAVATIVAIHVVFFGGLLLQGCKRDNKLASGAGDTNSAPASTNLTLPPINSDSLYYSNATNLPTGATASAQSNAQSATSAMDTLAPSGTTGSRDLWKSTNLTGNSSSATANDSAAGGRKEYTVARGDTFKKIAMANGTTVGALRKANPNTDPSKLKVGMKLQVPTGSPASASTSGSLTPMSSTGVSDASGAAATGDSYTVKAGDTLTKVAKAHGVTVSQLRAANNLKTSGLKVGQKLKIPAPSAAGTNETTSVKHTKASKTSTNSTNSATH